MSEGADVLQWWWIRHAPAAGKGSVIHGTNDAPADLTDIRSLQHVADLLPTDAVALTSAVTRARQTYAALRQANPALPAADIDSDLNEQDFGDWTGRTWDQLAVDAADFWKDPLSSAPPHGESYAAMSARVQRGIIARAAKLRRGSLIVVSHAGPIRAALALALDLTPVASMRFEIGCLSITRIESLIVDGGPAWRIREVGAKSR